MVAAVAPIPADAGLGSNIFSFILTGSVTSSREIVTGDYAVLCVTYESTSSADPTISAAPGFGTLTQLGTTQHFGTNRHSAVFGGFVTLLSTQDPQITVSAPATLGVVYSNCTFYRGVDKTTPIDVTTTQTTTSAVSSHPSAAIVPVTDGARVVMCFSASNDNGASLSAFTAPGGIWSVDCIGGTTLLNDASGSMFSTLVSPAASTQLTVASSLAVSAGIHSVALRPASTDPINEIYVGRSNSANAGAASGGFSRTINDPNQASIRQVPSSSTDLAVAVLWINDLGIALQAAPSAPWTPFVEHLSGSTILQVYIAPWSGGLVWPTFSPGVTIDKFISFGLILRDIDPTNPFNASALGGAVSATQTFPSVTPTGPDAILLKLAFIADDVQFPTANSVGDVIIIPNAAQTYLSTTGTDHGVVGIIEMLTGGAGVPTSSSTITLNSSIGATTYTLAFGRAPNVKSLVSSVLIDGLDVSTTLQPADVGVFLESEVSLVASVSTTLISRQHRRNSARRAFLWHSGPDGDRTGVIS